MSSQQTIPDCFQVSGITFSVAAKDPELKQQIDQIFSLCEKTNQNGDILVEAEIALSQNLTTSIPHWLIEILTELDAPQGLVSMFRGPSKEPAVAVICDKHISCAWLSAPKKIQIVLLQKGNQPPESKPKPPQAFRNSSGNSSLQFASEKSGTITSSVQSVLPPLLREVFLSQKKRLLIHSAALRCPDGTGILLIADGGCGKTTTALSTLRKGAQLLGDDLNFIEIGDAHVKAIGFPEMLNLTSDTISYFKELHHVRSRVIQGSGSHKKIVSPYDVYGDNCVIKTSDINVIYFIDICNRGPSVRKLTFGGAIGKLMHSQTFANNQILDKYVFEKLSDMLEKINAYDLRTGSCPEYIGEWLIQHCAEHATRKQ
jgi:hypothetical protein